jgi:PAS domain S-box-containing protein
VQKTLGLFPGSLLTSTLPEFWPQVRRVLKAQNPLSGIGVQAGEISYLARLAPFKFKDAIIGVLCVLDDRTELEKTTRKMLSYQELSQELDAIIASCDDGLWTCDGQGTILRMNAASLRLNMLNGADVIGRNISELIDEGVIDDSVTLKVMKSRQRETILQQTHTGRKLMVSGNPVFNPAGELIRVVANERDITEIDVLRRELEEQVAIKDQMRHQMLEMQLAELKATRIIARSPSMIKALGQALKLGQVNTTALILGESGTGKGVIADLIHKHSSRADHPMIVINCGAIPETLVETELFGYEKGAFTGADQKGKPGYLELANHGVLFLDEIAELPLPSQVKLLRFLEDGHVSRVGGTRIRQIDARVLCATHRDLPKMVAEGSFRQDLFYRLHVIPIRVPPLRERRECILPLIRHYLEHFTSRLDRSKPPQIGREAMDALMTYPYPGNVRELINLCERMVVMAEEEHINLEHLPASVITASAEAINGYACEFKPGATLSEMLDAVERRILTEARHRCDNQAQMAELLRVNQSTIARKLKKHGLG